MTEAKVTSLADFELEGVPTTVADLEQEASPSVQESFEEIEYWKTRVETSGETYLVGGAAENGRRGYNLYHTRNRDTPLSFAGKLCKETSYQEDWDVKIGFISRPDSPGDDTAVEPVENLDVVSGSRVPALDECLDSIRSSLTDSDWSDGRADPGYGEWISGANELAEHAKNWSEGPTSIPADLPQRNRVMHSLFRYPHDASTLLSQTQSTIQDHYENGIHEVSPHAFLEFLLHVADIVDG
jgi:hypothetical protein